MAVDCRGELTSGAKLVKLLPQNGHSSRLLSPEAEGGSSSTLRTSSTSSSSVNSRTSSNSPLFVRTSSSSPVPHSSSVSIRFSRWVVDVVAKKREEPSMNGRGISRLQQNVACPPSERATLACQTQQNGEIRPEGT